MLRYILKRILWIIPVIIGVITIIFMITEMVPGDATDVILDAHATEEQREEMREDLGLNRPLVVRWADYVVGIFTELDFGTSYITNAPIADELSTRIPVTFKLALFATALGVLVGIPLGILAALKQYTWVDSFVLFFSVLFVSMPNFWLAMMLIKLFAVDLQILPAFGISQMSGWILPIIVSSAGASAGAMRITRSSMLEVMRQDYIRTARAKGQKESVIVIRHMLRNSMIPVVTTIGASLGNALGGNMALEIIFAMPGIGNYVSTAITGRNYPAMLGGILVIAIMYTVISLLVDLAYVAIDPRLKTKLTGKKASKSQIRQMLKEQEAMTNA